MWLNNQSRATSAAGERGHLRHDTWETTKNMCTLALVVERGALGTNTREAHGNNRWKVKGENMVTGDMMGRPYTG